MDFVDTSLVSSKNKDIFQSVSLYILDGKKTSEAIKLVSENSGKSCSAARMAYYRGGGDLARVHGNRLLNSEQENMLVSILVVFSNLHNGLTHSQARIEVEHVLGVSISHRTLKRCIKRNEDRLTVKKSKLLSYRRMDPRVLGYVGTFCAQVMEMNERYPMVEGNVVNYDETRVYIGQGGETIIESKRKRRSQRKGIKGMSIGSWNGLDVSVDFQMSRGEKFGSYGGRISLTCYDIPSTWAVASILRIY